MNISNIASSTHVFASYTLVSSPAIIGYLLNAGT